MLQLLQLYRPVFTSSHHCGESVILKTVTLNADLHLSKVNSTLTFGTVAESVPNFMIIELLLSKKSVTISITNHQTNLHDHNTCWRG